MRLLYEIDIARVPSSGASIPLTGMVDRVGDR